MSNGNFQSGTSVQGFVNALQTSTSSFGAFDMPTNQWRFVALTYDGVTLSFYGGSETNAVALMSSSYFSAGTLPVGGSWTLFLGNRLTRDRAFRGWLDDVRFYDNAVPQAILDTIRRDAIAEPMISSKVVGSSFALRMQTKAGASYILQMATNLTPPVIWSSVTTNVGNGGILTNMAPMDSVELGGFYRYRIEQPGLQ